MASSSCSPHAGDNHPMITSATHDLKSGWPGLNTGSNRSVVRRVRVMIHFMVVGLLLPAMLNADDAPVFLRGINLNGPAVTIDSRAWEGSESQHYVCNDNAFENQNVPLVPPTDPERAPMIRSSRWGGNRIELTDIPPGTYTLFLYVWEDNNAETYSIAVNGRQVAARYNSGKTGHWEKLGPWHTSAKDGKTRADEPGRGGEFLRY